MPTSSLSPAWKEPRQFSVYLPPDFSPDTEIFLPSSATHVALSGDRRVYIYALPAFNLVHVLELQGLSSPQSLRIYGRILVVICSNFSENFEWGSSCSLYFWDLSASKSLGSLALNDPWHNVSVSSPGLMPVAIEENGELVREEWPKMPVLIVCSPQDQSLRIYTLHDSAAGSNYWRITTENAQESPALLPTLTISPIPGTTRCLASIGRTAVTGGLDATVRVWDIITGECRQVLIGHRSYVVDVCLDESRIYSSSYDNTVRVWAHHSGDCLHILNLGPIELFSTFTTDTTSRRLITASRVSKQRNEILIWDPISGKLIHRISNQADSWLGPIRDNERTLLSWEVGEGSSMDWLRIWDVRSGQTLMSLPIGLKFTTIGLCSQGRIVFALSKQGEEHLLKVWDFGPNNSVCARVVGGNVCTPLEGIIIDNAEEPRKGDLGKMDAATSSRMAVEGTVAGSSLIRGKRKRNQEEDSVRYLSRRLVGGEREGGFEEE
ncbi:hypothetical protein CVT26_005149 [Gymnopilus dilepis]|uniref:Uncharacterized protein n=1 Tax=Gymnopilus dilepis TaxID=231916 RepID=A0A409WIX6_9AGAR|nr:hypothetical protein CVT26_005149 [Gymnopilus dilepis]